MPKFNLSKLANIENYSRCADSSLVSLKLFWQIVTFWQIVSQQIVVDTLNRFGTFFDTNNFGKPHGSHYYSIFHKTWGPINSKGQNFYCQIVKLFYFLDVRKKIFGFSFRMWKVMFVWITLRYFFKKYKYKTV